MPRRSGDLSRHSAEGATAEAAEAGLFAPNELRLGKPREGCRAVAAKQRRRACHYLRTGRNSHRIRSDRWQKLPPSTLRA